MITQYMNIYYKGTGCLTYGSAPTLERIKELRDPAIPGKIVSITLDDNNNVTFAEVEEIP